MDVLESIQALPEVIREMSVWDETIILKRIMGLEQGGHIDHLSLELGAGR